jgi:Cu/Ag efflux protein CusF
MKKITLFVLAVTFVFAGAAMAAEMEGMIKSINTDTKEVSFDNGAVLVLDESTTITIEGSEGKLDDLKEGAKIKASYAEKDGKNVADKVEVSK